MSGNVTSRRVAEAFIIIGLAAWVIVVDIPLVQQMMSPPRAPVHNPIVQLETDGAYLLDDLIEKSLRFEENNGQTDDAVTFLSRAANYNLFLTTDEVVFAFLPREQASGEGDDSEEEEDEGAHETTGTNSYASIVRMQLVGANPATTASGVELLPGTVSYFIGTDPAGWIGSVPSYGGVRYTEIYPGIDLIYYGNQGELEYDFVVAPAADPAQIQLRFHGGDRLEIDDRGHLQITTAVGTIQQRKPYVYQDINGKRERIASSYVLSGPNQVGVRLAPYDTNRPLVIDPIVSYIATFGSSGRDYSFGVAVTPDGDAFVAGETPLPMFPPLDAVDPAQPAYDTHAFVAKVDAASASLGYFAFIGGDGYDTSRGVAVDGAGNAYLAGKTQSTNFPVQSPLQSAYGGGRYDVFVTKLSPDGSELVFSTYLGGDQGDSGRGIVVDGAGNAYVGGETASSNYPVTHAVQAARAGDYDGFITKISSDGRSLGFSTYLGGSSYDACRAITVDDRGNSYVTGATGSADFPVTNAVQEVYAGGSRDAFVTKFDADGSVIAYSTFLGGTGVDHGRGVAVDSSGHTYVTGKLTSTDLPTVNPFQSSYAGGFYDSYVAKLTSDGSSLIYSTYLGGSDREIARSIAVDEAGNAYVTGRTASNDFPTMRGIQSTFAGGGYDLFVSTVRPDGSSLVNSTFLGGTRADRGLFIALDAAGRVYVAGHTLSNDFPDASESTIHSLPSRDFDVILVRLDAETVR